jgi:hypothetical protein
MSDEVEGGSMISTRDNDTGNPSSPTPNSTKRQSKVTSSTKKRNKAAHNRKSNQRKKAKKLTLDNKVAELEGIIALQAG